MSKAQARCSARFGHPGSKGKLVIGHFARGDDLTSSVRSVRTTQLYRGDVLDDASGLLRERDDAFEEGQSVSTYPFFRRTDSARCLERPQQATRLACCVAARLQFPDRPGAAGIK